MTRAEISTRRKAVNLLMPTILWPEGCRNPLRVVIKSPAEHRRAVWRISQFFRREFGYDFDQYEYEGKESDPDHVAYLWVPPDVELAGWRVHCIDATCFRKREASMRMEWVWLNPFFRSRGLLGNAWPMLKAIHGEFQLCPPLSPAMEGFLKSLERGK